MENFHRRGVQVQANMDPSHRDRIAFVRVCSGKYEPGMKLKVQRSGGTPPHLGGDLPCRNAARRWTRPLPATSSASPLTAACNWATPSPTASTCNTPACLRARTVPDRGIENPMKTSNCKLVCFSWAKAPFRSSDPRWVAPCVAGAVGQLQFESGTAPPDGRVQRGHPPDALPLHRRALDHGRHTGSHEEVHRRKRQQTGAGRRGHPGLHDDLGNMTCA